MVIAEFSLLLLLLWWLGFYWVSWIETDGRGKENERERGGVGGGVINYVSDLHVPLPVAWSEASRSDSCVGGHLISIDKRPKDQTSHDYCLPFA